MTVRGIRPVERLERGQRWRQKSTGDEYIATKVGTRKAIFERRTMRYDVKASIWVKRLLEDPDWELIS